MILCCNWLTSDRSRVLSGLLFVLQPRPKWAVYTAILVIGGKIGTSISVPWKLICAETQCSKQNCNLLQWRIEYDHVESSLSREKAQSVRVCSIITIKSNLLVSLMFQSIDL